jgi:hypothetical protein
MHRSTPDFVEPGQVTDELVELLVGQHRRQVEPGLRRLWEYYRNDLDFSAGDEVRPYAAAQQQGLPRRLLQAASRGRRELVIENDIAWRLHAMVDFMVGKPVSIRSLAPQAGRAAMIQRLLDSVFDANGGVCFFQNLALLGAVYGFVDVLVRPLAGRSTAETTRQAPSNPQHAERLVHAASNLILETVEAPRVVPVLDPSDYRRLTGYILTYPQTLNEVERPGWLGRRQPRLRTIDVTEVWTPGSRRLWREGVEVERQVNLLGALPVVHIQNLPQPLSYEGLGEVEPLIPLQDELNTRLSDRANRVTLQSFKMYLGKGIENFTQRPVGPGQMWMTDNPDASIEAFGGDSHNPSEESHIDEIRQAMDKTSGVTALAAGVLRNRVGNLTSENALRVTLMGLLAKTQRKRITYGKGIEQICQLVLHALHVSGVFRTAEAERRVDLTWPSPLPENTPERLNEAELKLRIGVPRRQVLAELGYTEAS